jgi:hypothetical protein
MTASEVQQARARLEETSLAEELITGNFQLN